MYMAHLASKQPCEGIGHEGVRRREAKERGTRFHCSLFNSRLCIDVVCAVYWRITPLTQPPRPHLALQLINPLIAVSVRKEGRKEMDPTSGKKVMMLMKKKAKTIKNVPQKYIAVRVACMYVPR